MPPTPPRKPPARRRKGSRPRKTSPRRKAPPRRQATPRKAAPPPTGGEGNSPATAVVKKSGPPTLSALRLQEAKLRVLQLRRAVTPVEFRLLYGIPERTYHQNRQRMPPVNNGLIFAADIRAWEDGQRSRGGDAVGGPGGKKLQP